MNVIINTSTLVGSGVTQVATSFIYECLEINVPNEYHVFLSESVAKSIKQSDFDQRFKFYVFKDKPTILSIKGLISINKIKRISKLINPDVVFSVFGPSWWTPSVPNIQGYAYAYYVYPESPFLKKMSLRNKIKIYVSEKIHIFFLKRNGNIYVSETEDVTTRLKQKIGSDKKFYFTVSNTCSSFFRNFIDDQKISFLPQRQPNEFRFISLCTLQPHKNLQILNKVIPILNIKGYSNIKFVLTIEAHEMEKNFSTEAKKNIIALGRINPKACPYLFNECDALFLPTLIECFSANYPEAMYLQKPIVTSNLSFATQQCKNAALYFDPLDENDVVNKILELVNNVELQKILTLNGKEVLKNFLSSRQRAIRYLEILKNSMESIK